MRVVSSKRAARIAAANLLAAVVLAAALPQAAFAAPAPVATSEAAQAPHDPATGHTTGRRQHETVKIVREVDKASPAVAAPPATGSPASGNVDATVKSHSNTNNN